nr:hypothetical protein [Micromonospora sp. DSM 115978]
MAVLGTDRHFPADHGNHADHANHADQYGYGGEPSEGRAARRRTQSPARWPLAGIAAGVFGALASAVLVWDPTPEVTEAGTAAIAAEATDNHWTIFLGASAGFISIIALLVFAAGFTKLVERRAPDSLAVPASKLAFAATLGTLIFGFGLKHVLAGGAGGVDADFYTDSQVEVVGLIVSQMQYASWWGLMLVAGCTAVLA